MTVSEVRPWFPSLQSGFAYLENAGGSQALGVVVEAMRRHMLTDFVQLGAGYPQADHATSMVAEAHGFMREFVNAGDTGQVVLGPSTTALIHLVARAYGDIWKAGDEIVIAETNHEANAGGWERLEARGAKVRIWPMDKQTFRCEPSVLAELLNERTRIVTLPHASNLVGQIEDVKRVCEMAHAVGARVCVDGVAYAPHRAIDIQDLGADWYVFSVYKVYGPHMAVLFGRNEAFAELTGPNHSFVAKDDPYKWELGGVSHEACAGLLGLREYLGFLAGAGYSGRRTVSAAYREIEDLERPLEARLRNYLSTKPGIMLLGPHEARTDTVGTVSFVHESIPSDAISAAVNSHGVGIRHGSMYAVRLVEALGIPADPGVVRISVVHYNTLDEVDRVIQLLDAALLSSRP